MSFRICSAYLELHIKLIEILLQKNLVLKNQQIIQLTLFLIEILLLIFYMHQLFVQCILSRLAEDFIIYNSDAFALITFNDNMLTGSSIMPQKKNPDPAELIRGRVGISYGKLNSMLTIMKGLPMSYFKDLQDDKELVFDGYDTLKDTLIMSAELINAVKPIKKIC